MYRLYGRIGSPSAWPVPGPREGGRLVCAGTMNIEDVILLDVMMPGEVDRLLRLGARGVITKPFDPMTLPTELRDIVSDDLR